MSTGIAASLDVEVAQEGASRGRVRPCGARLRDRRSGTCRKQAGWGTDHLGYGRCRLHGGNTRTQRQRSAAEEARAEATKLALVMGSPMPTSPEDALQLCIDITRGEVDYCDRRIAEMTDSDAATPLVSERKHQELDRDGHVHELGDRVEQSTAELHIWITTRIGATERLARYSKMAMDAGVAERRVRLSEQQTEAVAGWLLAVVARLPSLSDVDRASIPALLEEHKPVIEGSVVA